MHFPSSTSQYHMHFENLPSFQNLKMCYILKFITCELLIKLCAILKIPTAYFCSLWCRELSVVYLQRHLKNDWFKLSHRWVGMFLCFDTRTKPTTFKVLNFFLSIHLRFFIHFLGKRKCQRPKYLYKKRCLFSCVENENPK